MENDAVFFMKLANEIAELRTKDAFQRPAFRRDDVNLQIPGPQCGCDFQTDEARADDDGMPRRPRAGDNGTRVGKRTQDVHMRLVGAWNRETDRLSARRKQELVKRD